MHTPRTVKHEFHDLKTDDVSSVVVDLLEDMSAPVLPVQRPGRTVAVQLTSGVLVTQHVVTHHREYCYKHTHTRPDIIYSLSTSLTAIF